MELINDRYQLLEVIASGGMATVWKARDTLLDRLVAVKRPHPGPPGDESAQRLGREARAAASLNHPNLITVYDFGTDETGPYLVMELVDGPTLQDMEARLESAEVIDMGARLAEALAAIHAAGIVHRDVKPANVIMSERGPLLTDFGIATDPDDTAELTQPGTVVATPSYAAPEVLAGEPPTPASDIYSLGVVIDELVRKTGAMVDESVNRAVASAVADSPSARPDAAGLADALARAVPTVSTPVPSDDTTMILETRPSPPPASATSEDEDRKIPAWVWAAGILVLVATGLTVVGLAMSGDDPPADAAIVSTTVVADDSTTTSSTTTMITTTTNSSPETRITDARNELESVLSRPPRSDLNPPEVEDVMKKVDEGIAAAREGDMDGAEDELEEVADHLDDKLSGDRLVDARAALHELADLLGVELDGDDDDD